MTTASAPAMSSPRSAPLRASVSVIVTTFRPGANRAASAAQFGTTLVGATMRNGGLPGSACLAWQISASDSQRLAESHVVGEDAAEAVLPQERQPLETVELVGPQPGLQRVRRLPAADAR